MYDFLERITSRLTRDHRARYAIIVLSLLLVGGVYLYTTRDTRSLLERRAAEIALLRKDDWVRGNPSTAKATLIEYGDFECESCGVYQGILAQIETDPATKNDIAFVFRHLPQTATHPNALLAAQVAEAAGKQGKFFEMHDLLYIHQKEWLQSQNTHDIFLSYARSLGLDEARFTKDIDASATLAKINTEKAMAGQLAIKSVPSFFIQGKEVSIGRTYDEFKTAVLARTYTH